MTKVLLTTILSFSSSFLLLYLLLPFFRSRLLDQPNFRSSHLLPTPRGGGAVFVFISSLCSLLFYFLTPFSFLQIIPLISFPLALIGLLDDFFDLSRSIRFVVHLLTSLVLILYSPLYIISSSYVLFFISISFLLLSVTAIINFMNFMDGIDGLLSGCLFISFFSIAIYFDYSLNIFALLGALLAFILWNWSPARLFMGDVGSTFLGSCFGGFVLSASSWSDALCLILLSFPLLADASSCVFRRLSRGQNALQPHRLHLYQRLHQAGWSHSRVSLTYMFATLSLSIAYHLAGFYVLISTTFIVAFFGFYLDRRVAVPFEISQNY